MRTIKFRGKRVDNGDWVYGDLLTNNPTPEILAFYGQYAVEKDTIGQFTGLLDKNGKEIYEGDIIKIEDEGVTLKPKVVGFYNGIFGAGDWSLDFYGENIIEIIGNIHDNPELIKKGE